MKIQAIWPSPQSLYHIYYFLAELPTITSYKPSICAAVEQTVGYPRNYSVNATDRYICYSFVHVCLNVHI